MQCKANMCAKTKNKSAMLLKVSSWLFLVPLYFAIKHRIVDLQVTITICLACAIAYHVMALPHAKLIDTIVVNSIAAFYTLDAIKHKYWGVVMMSALSLYVFLTPAYAFDLNDDTKHALVHALTTFGVTLYVLYRASDKRHRMFS